MAFIFRLWQRIRLWALSLLLLGAALAVLLGLLELALRWQALRSASEPRNFAQQSSYLPARMKPNAEGAFVGTVGEYDHRALPLETSLHRVKLGGGADFSESRTGF